MKIIIFKLILFFDKTDIILAYNILIFKLVIFFDKTDYVINTENVSCQYLHNTCSLNMKEFLHTELCFL